MVVDPHESQCAARVLVERVGRVLDADPGRPRQRDRRDGEQEPPAATPGRTSVFSALLIFVLLGGVSRRGDPTAQAVLAPAANKPRTWDAGRSSNCLNAP